MIIAFEGCDGTGKSTFAELVAEQIREARPGDRVEVWHRGVPERHVLEEYGVDIERLREEDPPFHVVTDRWHMGTLVYAPIYRDTGPFGELGVAGFRWVELLLAARGARTYVVSQSLDKIVQRLTERGEDYLQPEHVAQVRDRFIEISSWGATSAGVIQPPDGDNTEMAKRIVARAIEDEARALPLWKWPSYIGHPDPQVLLVGEKRSGDPEEFKSDACFMPDNANRAGTFLLEALPEYFWKTVGIANAYETDDMKGLIEFLGNPPVVALGRSASDALLDLDIEHGALPHPSYVKRFHPRQKIAYGEMIQDASFTGEVNLSWPK